MRNTRLTLTGGEGPRRWWHRYATERQPEQPIRSIVASWSQAEHGPDGRPAPRLRRQARDEYRRIGEEPLPREE